MSCERFEEKIALYVGGELDAEEVVTVMDHLRVCRECSALAGALEQDGRRLATDPPEMATVDFAAMRRAIVRRTRRRLLPVLLAAAALLLAAGAAIEWRTIHRLLPPIHMAHAVPPAPPTESMPVLGQKGQPLTHGRVKLHSRPQPVVFVPPGAFRVPTQDPSVIIIWFSDSKGDSRD